MKDCNHHNKDNHNHHEHQGGCCGSDHHDHEHQGGCCGSDHHDHEHQGGCCGSDNKADSSGGCCNNKSQEPINLNKEELTLLLDISQNAYLPVSQFVMTNSENDAVGFIALPAVYLKTSEDSLEDVKERSQLLRSLEGKGLISLDYDIELEGYDYKDYLNSFVYSYFIQTVKEGKDKPDFICDTAEIDLGSMALTPLGIKAIDSIHIED